MYIQKGRFLRISGLNVYQYSRMIPQQFPAADSLHIYPAQNRASHYKHHAIQTLFHCIANTSGQKACAACCPGKFTPLAGSVLVRMGNMAVDCLDTNDGTAIMKYFTTHPHCVCVARCVYESCMIFYKGRETTTSHDLFACILSVRTALP